LDQVCPFYDEGSSGSVEVPDAATERSVVPERPVSAREGLGDNPYEQLRFVTACDSTAQRSEFRG
jgi:hypothetical protein